MSTAMLIRKTFYSTAFLLLTYFSPSCQVNLQTGSAVFSLPMFSWQDDKSRLTSVIALSYNSGNGLKVSDVASNVGQGWSLVAGGVITRMQIGEPDDQPADSGTAQYGNGNDQDLTKYPAGYLYGTTPATNGCPNALTKYPTYGGPNILYTQHNTTAQDRQMDIFTFQFNGKSGMFVLDTAGGDHGIPLNDSKMKISFVRDPTMTSQGIRTTITSFTITDVDGLIYKFTYHGLTKLLKASFSNSTGTKQQTQPKINDQGVYCQSAFDLGPTASPWINQYMAYPYLIGSWYLSEVDDPFTTRKITFTYNTLSLNNSAGYDISYNSSLNHYIVISYKKSISTTLEIASITYPDQHTVTFNYATTQRADLPGEKALASVDIKYQSRYLAEYQLNTTYFILTRYGTPTNRYQASVSRLCLRSVKKIGVDLKEDSPPYLFDYYIGSNNTDEFVPPPFFYAKDVWGYYNGNNSIKSNSPITGTTVPVPLTDSIPYQLDFYSLKGLCFQNDNVSGIYLNAKPAYAQNGLLKQVIYPTGGSLSYQYAQNTGTLIGGSTVINIGGVHVSQTSSSDAGYSNGCSTPIVTQYNYVMNGTGSASSLWGAEMPVNSLVTNNSYAEEKQTIHFSLSCPLGCCLWHYVYPGILSQNEAINIGDFQKIMIALAPVLGVLSVIEDVMDVINVCGVDVAPIAIVAVVLDVIGTVLTYVLGCPQNTKYTPNTMYYDFDLNEGSPLPMQFKRVEVTVSPGTAGKTVQQFTNADDDYPLWFAAGTNTTFSPKQRYAPWAYGLPKLTTVYDVNGNKIKETQNVYDFSFAQETLSFPYSGCSPKLTIAIPSCKCQVINNYSQRSDNWSNPTLYNDPTTFITSSSADMGVDIYNIYTGRVRLTTTYERTYRTSDATQYVQTETDYYYNIGGPYYKLGCDNYTNYDIYMIVTKQSNGDVNYKTIKYSGDYNTGILATFCQKNMLSVPVATSNYVIKYGTSTIQYLSEKVTEFTQLSNSDVKPSRIIEQRFATPVTSFTPYSGPTTTNYSIYKIPQQFTYDANGNMTGLKDEGGRTVTNIYDYNDKYIVASVINADPTLDKTAYTSFESQDLSRSGWSLSGISSYNSNPASPTGVLNFALLSQGANTLTASSLNTSKPYILSFWANNNNVTVTGGASLVKSAPTLNGFTYYEYNIAQGTSSVVLKNNNTTTNANIDELRLYPSTARMRTTTYDPLIGKTSECDENNRIIYYAYDNLGRLRFVEDENMNVVKMYEYNNVSPAKQQGCPATYNNHLVSEIFTRSNCGSGYQGSNVTYTVPANRYSSSKSQWDADIQAEIDVLTNGQTYANTNGSCALIYYNTAKSQSDSTQSCAAGYVGGWVTYTVPAGTYSSIISQADADQQALNDVAANALAYANAPATAACTLSTTADWEWNTGDPTYCLSVNGQLPPHLFLQATDLNPNSPTYNQKQWEDNGPGSSCPANTYYNAQQSANFTRNNCSAGYTGTTVTYTVPPGKYSSTVSQAAADQQATNDINANGQAYANANGSCVQLENVVYTNSRTFQYSVRFTNISTQAVYNFTANANVTTSTTLGQVPSGTYTVYICPYNNYTPNNNYTVQGVTQTSVVCATFNNVSVASTATLRFY